MEPSRVQYQVDHSKPPIDLPENAQLLFRYSDKVLGVYRVGLVGRELHVSCGVDSLRISPQADNSIIISTERF